MLLNITCNSIVILRRKILMFVAKITSVLAFSYMYQYPCRYLLGHAKLDLRKKISKL